MTNASLGLNDIRKINDVDEEENYGRCESPVLSKIIHRSQRSINEMTPDDSEFVEPTREAVTPLPATPQPLTANDLAATVPVEKSAVNPSLSIETNLMPSTAKIPESLCDLLNFENTSWTSSLATPHGRNVTYSNLNTEEKKVLVSSNPVPRALFTPEVKEEQSQKSLNESYMECSEIVPIVEPKKLCKGCKEFSTTEIFSSNDSSQNTTALTGVDKFSDFSLSCSTTTKEPRLVREVLDLLVSPVSASGHNTYLKAKSLSETPSHSSNYKYAHELCKLSKLRPKAKRLFRKGSEPCSDRDSDTTVTGDQFNSDTDSPTVSVSEQQPISPNLSGTFIFASPVSPVLKTKADEKHQEGAVMSCSPVLHRTQEFLHDFSFSTLEEVCQASEVLASGCTSPVENHVISNNCLSQKRQPYTIQNVSPIQFEEIARRSSSLVVNKTSTPIHTEKNKKVCANKKKIKFLNIHQGQRCGSSVKEHKEKSHSLCNPQVTSQKSDGVEQNSKYDNNLQQHNHISINKNNCVELNSVLPDTTETLRHRVVSVKSNAKQKKKFAYFSELGTYNSVNITRFPSVDAVLSNMLQSAEALEAVSLLQNENISISLKKHLEQMCGTETDFVPFNKLNLASPVKQSITRNFVNTSNSLKTFNVSEEESKINVDEVLRKTLGDHTVSSRRKRKSNSHGTLGDQSLTKRTCKELKNVQFPEMFKRPDSNNLQPYVSDTQLNVVFDNVEAIVAEFNSKCARLRTVGVSCDSQNPSNLNAENKCPSSLVENFDNENVQKEGNNSSNGNNRIEFCNMDKNEIDPPEKPIELKAQNNYSLKCDLPVCETSSASSGNQYNRGTKEFHSSENISLCIGSSKMDSITKQSEVKQIVPKVCKFNCHEIKVCHSEVPVTEAYNETSFLNTHQHIFDSSFTAVTQKATEFVGKEQTKEEALLGSEQRNSVECNITYETKEERSPLLGSTQNLLEMISEDNAHKGEAAEHIPDTEIYKNESSVLCLDSESNVISENEYSHQQSHMMNMRPVLQKKYDTVSHTVCKTGSHTSKIQMNGSPVNEDLKDNWKFSHDKHYEKIPCSDKFLQDQSTVDNAEKGLCAQSNILGVEVLDGSNYGMFFTTAKGKRIQTPKKCLDLACNLFRDIIEPNIEQFDGQALYKTQKGITKTVTKSEEGLTKLKVSENNDTKNRKENSEKNDSSEMQNSKMESLNLVNMSTTGAVPLQVGFSTASGKKFTVSEKSLHRAKHIFQTVMELETTGDNTLLKDYNLFSVGDTDTPPITNTNLEICSVLPENAMHLSEQFQNKVENFGDASSNGKTWRHARPPESVIRNHTMLSENRDICVKADSHLSLLQKQQDETKKPTVKFKTKPPTDDVGNDEQNAINILVQISKPGKSLLKIDSATADTIELDVKSKKVESGFTTAAGGRLFILGKSLHKTKKIFSDILLQHSSESKDCSTDRESSAEGACEGNHESDNTVSTNKVTLRKTHSYKTVQGMLSVGDNDNLLIGECDASSAADLLMSSCTLTGSALEDTNTKCKTAFLTLVESGDTLPQKLVKVEDNCHISQTEISNSEFCKGLNNESNLNRGFMTAAGRKITVSAASLDRAKRLMSENSVMNEDDSKNIVAQVKRGDLKDSLMSQQKHNMLEKEHIKKVNSVLLTEDVEESKTGLKGSLLGHKLTKSVNKLTIPETVAQTDLRAKKCPENISAVPEQVAKSHFSCGFQTAAGKPLEISLASLSKVEEMFDDIMIPVTKGHDCFEMPQRKEMHEQFKKSQKNAETISPSAEKNISVQDEFMKTLNTINVIERKLETSFSSEKNDTLGEMCSSKKVYGSSLDKVKNTLFSKPVLIEPTSDIESESELKTFDKKGNSVSHKISQMSGGFVTAGGKPVDVSEESLMRVRNLFSDITENDEGTTFTVGNMKEKEAINGSSSKGKKVISPEKMKNSLQGKTIETKRISRTEYKNEFQITQNNKNSMVCKKLKVCGGFVTAGGKKVDVSEESLLKVRNLFSDLTETVGKTTVTAENVNGEDPIEKYSAKGRDVISPKEGKNLSSERTVEMEKISDTEYENEVQILDKENNSLHCKRLSMSACFTTAGGKQINVSEESLARVKNLFSDTTENVENDPLTVDNMKLKEAPEVYSIEKKDLISIEKVNNKSPNRNVRTRKISDREFQNGVKLLDKKENFVHCERLNVCGGFVTAGGRNVGVSEASLAKARNLFSDLTENVEETEFNLRNVKEKEATAMNCVNEKLENSSPNKRTGEFENEVNLLDKEENFISCEKQNMYGVIVTASGIEKIKENQSDEWQCLKKKAVLCSEIVEKPLLDRSIGTKKISSSESENEVKLFDKKQNVNNEKLKIYGGFVTGCGKKVEVSEESLAKVRSLFSEMTDNEENPSVVLRNVDSSSYMEKSGISGTDFVQNYFSLDMETHHHTPHQESTTKRSKILDSKNYVSYTTTSNKPHANVLIEDVLQHKVKINAASKPRIQKHEPTLTQEVSESTAALLLDDDFKKELEESDSSCFSMLTERSCSPDFSVSMGSIDRDPGSPVIGSKNKCNRTNKAPVRRNISAKKAERISASVKNVCDQSRFEDKSTTQFIPEVNGRKRCSSIKDNQMHKKQCMSNVDVNENVGETPAAKMKAQVIPSPGSWLQLRMSDQKQCVQWRDISYGNPPLQLTESELLQYGVKKSVINVTSKSAGCFKFFASDFYREGNCQSILAGDGKSLEFDVDGFAGVQEVERAFLTSPAVDKSLIPVGWIQNHYRWIVWKLAATERSFPHIFASRYLTPRVLLLQLKYRYDREIDRCQRSALKRILEHDDAPGKRMVLCVADVIKHEEPQEENGKEGSRQCLKMCKYELELTDGWYSIRCTVDMEMCHLIETGRVAIGTKLVTHSAELVNCEQPCPPLEAGPGVRLKIHTNSTRRARWDCRLGYCRQPGPLPVSLNSLKPAGGVISCVTAVIARVYPIVYMEKGPDGKAEFYSAKQEALRASKRERQWQEHIEKLYSQERAQLSQIEWFSACSQQSKPKGMSNKHVTTPTRQQLAAATCGEDLYQLLCNAPDPVSLQSLLTEEQQDAVTNYQQMHQQQLLQELEARVRKRIEEERKGTSSLPLLKVRCLDAKDCSARSAVLCIWRPSEDLLPLFQEGSVLKLFSITANGLRNGDLQLSACRQSRYQPQPYQPPKDFPARCVTPLSRVSSGNLHATFGELDCVGVVVHVAPLSGNYQTVYLADADMDIVGISFWNGLKGSGWEDILQQKALVACSNLQSRVGAAVHWIPTTYATEFSIFSQHPRQKHLVEALASLRRNLNMDIDNFSYTCEGIVLSFLNEQIVTPVRNASLDVRQTKPSTAGLSRLNTPGVTPEPSEKVQRRLFKLEQYGEPPSLSPLALIPRSRVLSKSFHVPLKTDQTAELSCDDSPPMSLDSDDT